MMPVKMFVFGAPRLVRAERAVEQIGRKALGLLVYLAVTGQPHSRDALAALFWPEARSGQARTNLRTLLHRLAQALGSDLLEAGADTIRLHAHADLWLDSATFRQHATVGLPAALEDALALARLEHLTAATALYTDDFLAGFSLPDNPAFDEWQLFQRESLRQLYGQVLEQLVQAYRTQGAWDAAISYARRWVALDGLHEPAHRTLMQLYTWAGQPAAALRQYQECARILETELGVAPEDETTALHEAIRTRQFTEQAAADRPPTSPPRASELAPPERYVLEELLASGWAGRGVPRAGSRDWSAGGDQAAQTRPGQPTSGRRGALRARGRHLAPTAPPQYRQPAGHV